MRNTIVESFGSRDSHNDFPFITRTYPRWVIHSSIFLFIDFFMYQMSRIGICRARSSKMIAVETLPRVPCSPTTRYLSQSRTSVAMMASDGQGVYACVYIHIYMVRIECGIMSGCVTADLDKLLQEDMKRLATKRGVEQEIASTPSSAEEGRSSSLKDIVDKVLIGDFFFVLFALGWFGIGIGVKSSSGDSVCAHKCGVLQYCTFSLCYFGYKAH